MRVWFVAQYQGSLAIETELYLKKQDAALVLWMPHISDFETTAVWHQGTLTALIQLHSKSLRISWIWWLR